MSISSCRRERFSGVRESIHDCLSKEVEGEEDWEEEAAQPAEVCEEESVVGPLKKEVIELLVLGTLEVGPSGDEAGSALRLAEEIILNGILEVGRADVKDVRMKDRKLNALSINRAEYVKSTGRGFRSTGRFVGRAGRAP